MQWWNNFVDWFYSPAGQTVLFSAVIPFVAILAAGLVATAIARGSIARLMRRREEELKTSAVIGLLDGARQASVWHSLLPNEQLTADRLMGAADVQLRLLPIPGASVAANWAGHEIREFKRASATFTLQFDAPLAEFRDRLIDWERHPRRARKIFERDLARWSEERSREDQLLQQEQDAWAAEQRPQRNDGADAKPGPVLAAAPLIAPVAGPAVASAAVPVDTEAVHDQRRDDDRRDEHVGPMRQVRADEPFRRPDRIGQSAGPISPQPEHPLTAAAYLDDVDDEDLDQDLSQATTQTTTVVPRLEREIPATDAALPTTRPAAAPFAGSPLSRPFRPTLPTQVHDGDEEPGSVERPTDEPYAPPIPAAFGRSRPSRE